MSDIKESGQEKLAADLRVVIADAEELLRATASQMGEKAIVARERIQESLREAKAKLAASERPRSAEPDTKFLSMGGSTFVFDDRETETPVADGRAAVDPITEEPAVAGGSSSKEPTIGTGPRNDELTIATRPLSAMWLFVVLAVVAVIGYWVGSKRGYFPEGFWFQVVYGLISIELVVAAYIFGVGKRSQVQPSSPKVLETRAPFSKTLASSLSPFEQPTATAKHALGPPLRTKLHEAGEAAKPATKSQ